MLSWQKHFRGSPSLVSWSTRTNLGTAVIHARAEDGSVVMDMWRPDQTSIGKGRFPNADAAKRRAESILDPRPTWFDLIDPLSLSDDALDGPG